MTYINVLDGDFRGLKPSIRMTEDTMEPGAIAYLSLVIGAAVIFMAVLAYCSYDSSSKS